MNSKKMMIVILMSVALVAGCGTDAVDKNADHAGATADQEQKSDKDEQDSTENGNDSEEKTEIRREKYDDCDGSGHGYVEIYYSDGSMETEEY